MAVVTESVLSGWRVFFADPGRRWPEFTDPVGKTSTAQLPGLMRAHDRRAAQPFLLGPDGRADVRVNGFFTTHPMAMRDLVGFRPLRRAGPGGTTITS